MTSTTTTTQNAIRPSRLTQLFCFLNSGFVSCHFITLFCFPLVSADAFFLILLPDCYYYCLLHCITYACILQIAVCSRTPACCRTFQLTYHHFVRSYRAAATYPYRHAVTTTGLLPAPHTGFSSFDYTFLRTSFLHCVLGLRTPAFGLGRVYSITTAVHVLPVPVLCHLLVDLLTTA